MQVKKSIQRLYYRRKEVAEMFGISLRTVDRKIQDGYIKATKGGHTVFIISDSVNIENMFASKPKFNNEL
jgi:excisionase family DNA binding protein